MEQEKIDPAVQGSTRWRPGHKGLLESRVDGRAARPHGASDDPTLLSMMDAVGITLKTENHVPR